jgi:hypothetical protein
MAALWGKQSARKSWPAYEVAQFVLLRSHEDSVGQPLLAVLHAGGNFKVCRRRISFRKPGGLQNRTAKSGCPTVSSERLDHP